MTLKYVGLGIGAIICTSSLIGIPFGLILIKLCFDISNKIKENEKIFVQ